jgi:sporulation integral membrane protein YlbJ
MSFTLNSSPLFMLAAVAIGLFTSPKVGLLIAGAHYLSNLTLGLFLRFYGKDSGGCFSGPPQRGGSIVRHAFQRMFQVQRADKRPLGKIMGDAVRSAVTNLLNIGGFIILFAVIIRLLTAVGVIDALAGVLGILLLPLGFAPGILPALSSGFFEMTIGSKLASEAAVPLIQQVTAVGMILAWSGLSVQAQAASMIAETDIRMKPFILTRLAHTALAGLYTYLACRWFAPLEDSTAPAMAAAAGWQGLALYTHAKIFGVFLIILLGLILLALLAHLTGSLRLFFLRLK